MLTKKIEKVKEEASGINKDLLSQIKESVELHLRNVMANKTVIERKKNSKMFNLKEQRLFFTGFING